MKKNRNKCILIICFVEEMFELFNFLKGEYVFIKCFCKSE